MQEVEADAGTAAPALSAKAKRKAAMARAEEKVPVGHTRMLSKLLQLSACPSSMYCSPKAGQVHSAGCDLDRVERCSSMIMWVLLTSGKRSTNRCLWLQGTGDMMDAYTAPKEEAPAPAAAPSQPPPPPTTITKQPSIASHPIVSRSPELQS